MQKKIIALAIAAMVSAPAFADNANITFYGLANVSNDFVDTGSGMTTANGATAVSGTNKRVVSSNVSKFGFKGSEDLGNGLAAVWQVEQQVNIDTGANTLATRNTFAGLKSDSLGTVLIGIHDTPYKISTRGLDVFGDNIADNRSLMGKKSAAGFELRPTDVLAYISPAFAGVTVAVATVNLTEANTTSAQKNSNALSAAAMYSAAPFYASVAYESHVLDSVLPTVTSPKESATRVGFGFKPEGFELNVVYEKTSDNLTPTTNANLYGHSAYYVGGKYLIGADAVKLSYIKADKTGVVANSDATQVAVGYDMSLSKRTTLYALYAKLTNGKGINYAFSQNSGAASTVSGYGAAPTTLSIGLKHSF
ncbi:MAG: porin [Gallionellaceae bacterium]|jgi:predicted porin